MKEKALQKDFFIWNGPFKEDVEPWATKKNFIKLGIESLMVH